MIFILDQLDLNLEESDKSSDLLLNLFGSLISSLSLYAENESVIRPYTKSLMEKLLDKLHQVENPIVYLQIMQKLFRGLSGGRYENFYQELLPLLDKIIRSLLQLLDNGSNSGIFSDLVLELCLTIPAKISSLLPVMPLSIQAVLKALKSTDDLVVKLALRTLDFWVGKIKHEFLFIQMASYLSEIMNSLCDLIQLNHSIYGQQALKILGRLGGRNRAFLLNEAHLIQKVPYQDSICADLHLKDKRLLFKLDLSPFIARLQSLISVIDPADSCVQMATFGFIKSAILSIFDLYSPYSKNLNQIIKPGFWNSDGISSFSDQQMLKYRDRAFVQEKLLEHLLNSLFSLLHFEAILKDVEKFLIFIANHVGILFVGFSSEENASSLEKICFNPIPILQCIRTYLSPKFSEKCREVSFIFLNTVLQTIVAINGVEEASESFGMRFLLGFFIKCCYESQIHEQYVGCLALELFVSKLGASWIRRNYVDVIRALIFCCVESDDYYSKKTRDFAKSIIRKSIKVYLEGFNEMDSEESSKITKNLVLVIFPEIISQIPCVRDSAFEMLEEISDFVKKPLSDLLKQFYQRLLNPILTNSLDTVSVTLKIAFFSALSKCLLLKPPFIIITPELTKLLHDIVNFVLKEERPISQYSTSVIGRKTSDQATKLRVESIKLISVALVSPALGDLQNDQRQIKTQITLALFRSLMHSTKEVVDAAKYGLAMVTSQETLPKELLQECLRPILLKLADARKLDNNLLKLLEHLLELLSSCFNATLGEKLLDHLFYFSEALKAIVTEQTQVANSLSSGNSTFRALADVPSWHEIRIPTAIIHLFHLLPPAPRQFLTKLVMNVVNLEGILPRLRTYGENCVGFSTPFRKPLLKFLSKYAAEAVAFFLTPKNLVERTLSQMFLSILRNPEGEPIRKTLMFAHDQLLAATFNIEQTQKNSADARRHVIPSKAIDELQLQGIHIVYELAQLQPDWLTRCPKVIHCLLASWKSYNNNIKNTKENELPYEHIAKWKLIAKCLMIFCAQDKNNINVLWTLLPAFWHRTLVDFSFLETFFKEKIAKGSSSIEKGLIIREFFLNVLLVSCFLRFFEFLLIFEKATKSFERFEGQRNDTYYSSSLGYSD
jgi:transformation/transcription domain-associated protein